MGDDVGAPKGAPRSARRAADETGGRRGDIAWALRLRLWPQPEGRLRQADFASDSVWPSRTKASNDSIRNRTKPRRGGNRGGRSDRTLRSGVTTTRNRFGRPHPLLTPSGGGLESRPRRYHQPTTARRGAANALNSLPLSGHCGHGRTCCWLDPVANDSKRTFAAVN
jgi:hypothetical protein